MVIGPGRLPPLVAATARGLIPVMTEPTPPVVGAVRDPPDGAVCGAGPHGPADGGELWIVLHGYGQLATDFLAACAALDDGSRLIVAPEALSRFYDVRSPLERHAAASVGASWMTREERAEEIVDQLHWLQQVHDHYRAIAAPSAPLTVLGFSQGTAAASRWVAHGGVTPAHLICWGGSIAPSSRSIRPARCSAGRAPRWWSASGTDSSRPNSSRWNVTAIRN